MPIQNPKSKIQNCAACSLLPRAREQRVEDFLRRLIWQERDVPVAEHHRGAAWMRTADVVAEAGIAVDRRGCSLGEEVLAAGPFGLRLAAMKHLGDGDGAREAVGHFA